MTGKIFVCYRRDDSQSDARALAQTLKAKFGAERVFLDVDEALPGEKWRPAVAQQIEACDCCVVVIGKTWLTITDHDGNLRLTHPDDRVRFEIETALGRDIRVFPIEVSGGKLPKPHELPPSIHALAEWGAKELRHENYDADAKPIIDGLQKALDERAAERAKVEADAKKAIDAQAETRRLEALAESQRLDAARKVDAERRVVEAQKVEAARLAAKKVVGARLAAEKAKADAEVARRAAEAKKAADVQAEARRLEAEAARKADVTRKAAEAKKVDDARLAAEKAAPVVSRSAAPVADAQKVFTTLTAAKPYRSGDYVPPVMSYDQPPIDRQREAEKEKPQEVAANRPAATFPPAPEQGQYDEFDEDPDPRAPIWILLPIPPCWLVSFLISYFGGPSWASFGSALALAGTIFFGGWFTMAWRRRLKQIEERRLTRSQPTRLRDALSRTPRAYIPPRPTAEKRAPRPLRPGLRKAADEAAASSPRKLPPDKGKS